MQVERPNQPELSPEEQAQLTHLRKLVQAALADGKISQDEIAGIRAFIHADGKVTIAELTTIRATVKECLGDAALEYDW